MYCVVKNCRSYWQPNLNITFHGFPKDEARRKTWLSKLPLKGKFNLYSKICSLHFKPDDYNPQRPGRLKNNATPFFIPHSCHCVAKSTKACCLEFSTSIAEPNSRPTSVNTETTSIEILQHKSNDKLANSIELSKSTAKPNRRPASVNTETTSIEILQHKSKVKLANSIELSKNTAKPNSRPASVNTETKSIEILQHKSKDKLANIIELSKSTAKPYSIPAASVNTETKSIKILQHKSKVKLACSLELSPSTAKPNSRPAASVNTETKSIKILQHKSKDKLACSLELSPSTAKPNSRPAASVNTETKSIKILQHKSKDKLLFKLLTSPRIISPYQGPQPESSRVMLAEQPKNEAIHKNISHEEHIIMQESSSDVETATTSSAQARPESDDAKGHGEPQAKKRKVAPVQDSSESSDASCGGSEQAEPGAALCCCCLRGAGSTALAAAGPAGAALADMLRYCCDITYPAALLATATVCRECVGKLSAGVRFKRRALECLRILTACQQPDDSVTMNEKPVDPDDVGVLIVDATQSTLDKIMEEYDLSTDHSRLLTDHDEPVDANQHIDRPIFAETPITVDDILTQAAAKLTQEDEKFFKDGCKCGQSCHKLFSKHVILAFRRDCEKYCDTNQVEVFLTGALACVAGRSTPGQEASLRFRDVPVCREFFMYVFALNQSQIDTVLTKIADRSVTPWPSNSSADQVFAVQFLRDYSSRKSLILPGTFTNRHPDLHILPRSATKSTIYSEYARACVSTQNRCVNDAVWEKLWERLCPYIVQRVPGGLCAACRSSSRRSGSLSAAARQQRLAHLRLARDEAAFRSRAMQRPLGGGGTLHCSVDCLQRLRLPPGPVALLAVACQPPGETVVYIVPERAGLGADSGNILVSLLNHFLESKSARSVQCHCGPLLRAERVLQYAAWRGRAGRCRLAFLPPGHDAHIRADCRALLQRAARDEPARTVQDLCRGLASAGATPVLVPPVPLYDWRGYFDAREPAPVPNIRDYCHFEADAAHVGALKCRVSVTSDTAHDVTIFNSARLAGAPRLLRPPETTEGLDDDIQPHMDEPEIVVQYLGGSEEQELDPLGLVKEEITDDEEHDVS